MLVLTGTSGKLGSEVLKTILEEKLIPPHQLVVSTMSDANDPKFKELIRQGVTVRQSNYDDIESMTRAFTGCDRLFLISSPNVAMDFSNGPVGTGREKHHFNACEAAVKAGVKHIYYTSLVYAASEISGVGRAHRRTEEYLKELNKKTGITYTSLREGAYVEVWPAFFGNYDYKNSTQNELLISGVGSIKYTTVADLGFVTAYILASLEYVGKNLTIPLLHPIAVSFEDIVKIIAEVKKINLKVKVVPSEEAIKSQLLHADPTIKSIGEVGFKYWDSLHRAVAAGDGLDEDNTLERIAAEHGRKLTDPKDAIRKMLLE